MTCFDYSLKWCRLSLASRALTVVTSGAMAVRTGHKPLRRLGSNSRPRLEFVLPLLGRDDDLLLAGLHHTKRQKIRSARKRGLAVREMSDPSGVECLLKLQRCSSRRIVARGGQDISYPGDARAHPVNLLLRDGTAKILVAFEGDEALNAVATTFFNGVAYDLLSGHSDRGFELQSGTFVIWSAMRRFRDSWGTAVQPRWVWRQCRAGRFARARSVRLQEELRG